MNKKKKKVVKPKPKKRSKAKTFTATTSTANRVLPQPKIRIPTCAFTSCTRLGTDNHHVTYDPDVIKPLCLIHHIHITMINSVHARKYHQRLSPKYRWHIWFEWLKGKYKPKHTKRALESAFDLIERYNQTHITPYGC